MKSSWFLAIDLVARTVSSTSPVDGATQVGPRTWLRVLAEAKLPPEDMEWLTLGLTRVAAHIEAACALDPIVVEVEHAYFTVSDFQPDALAPTIIGWASEEFGFEPPTIDIHFDKENNRYVITL